MKRTTFGVDESVDPRIRQPAQPRRSREASEGVREATPVAELPDLPKISEADAATFEVPGSIDRSTEPIDTALISEQPVNAEAVAPMKMKRKKREKRQWKREAKAQPTVTHNKATPDLQSACRDCEWCGERSVNRGYLSPDKLHQRYSEP